MLGGLLGKAGTAARRRGSTKAADQRVDAAENKLDRLLADLEELDAELTEDVAEIEEKWTELAEDTATIEVGLEANDVKVAQLSLTWVPVD